MKARSERSRRELPKTYDPAKYEEGIYRRWEKSGAFQPASDHDLKLRKTLKPYTIIMPPPNVTGVLHAGHALMLTLEDILIRYHRMKGFDTLWLPGTDHAAIATENVVERKLAAEKKTKQRLGRPKFVAQAKQWATDYQQAIQNQMRAIGVSADWTRNAFTMDKPREEAVNQAFQRLYQKGLIYRDSYMVNWCPHCQTVLADDEVEYQEQEGVLYHMKYGPFVLATTRPETKVGDTAVAVHPDDKRYKKWVGKVIDVQTINGIRQLKVIADKMVNPEFGTGVVKITPFHDRNDYEVSQRHNLPALEVVGEDGQMTKAAGPQLAGLDRFEARKVMVSWLKKQKLLVKEELHRHAVGRCYRSDDIIEPRISTQWFVKVSEIARQAIKFVDDGELKFVPSRFEKTYRDWLGNLHDWCISRQIWFGHPLPAYLNSKGETSLTKKPGFKPSSDTLDTWFSSALWPFSTMGWPARAGTARSPARRTRSGGGGTKQTPDFKRFFPGDVLETGYEIIFFWVARMVLMTIALDVRNPETKSLMPPFHTVYLNGIVRDKRGRKFSKSLGNGVDPLEMIGRYGTDALRFMLTTAGGPGADIRFDEQQIVDSRNFANKLWNISRFVLSSSLKTSISQTSRPANLARLDSQALTTLDRGILHKLRQAWLETERVFYDENNYAKAAKLPAMAEPPGRRRAYDLAHAGQALYSFIWSDFADWYLETAKAQLKNPERRRNTEIILRFVLENVLKLLHPFMPFVTEVVWTEGIGKKQLLISEAWPQLHEDLDQPEDAQRFDEIRNVVETIRRLRQEHNVPAASLIEATIVTNEPAWLTESNDVIKRLARLSELTITVKQPKLGKAISAASGSTTVSLPAASFVDEAAEQKRLQVDIAKAKMEVNRLRKRLANKHYVSKAPKHIIAQTKTDLAAAERKLKKLTAQAT